MYIITKHCNQSCNNYLQFFSCNFLEVKHSNLFLLHTCLFWMTLNTWNINDLSFLNLGSWNWSRCFIHLCIETFVVLLESGPPNPNGKRWGYPASLHLKTNGKIRIKFSKANRKQNFSLCVHLRKKWYTFWKTSFICTGLICTIATF